MELNDYDKNTLIGIKNHLSKDIELVNEMWLRETDKATKHSLEDIREELTIGRSKVLTLTTKLG